MYHSPLHPSRQVLYIIPDIMRALCAAYARACCEKRAGLLSSGRASPPLLGCHLHWDSGFHPGIGRKQVCDSRSKCKPYGLSSTLVAFAPCFIMRERVVQYLDYGRIHPVICIGRLRSVFTLRAGVSCSILIMRGHTHPVEMSNPPPYRNERYRNECSVSVSLMGCHLHW